MSALLNLFSQSSLLDLALKSAAVMLLGLAIASLLARASAARRHFVWSLSLASLLVLPALSLALPAWRVSWLPAWPGEYAIVAIAESTPAVEVNSIEQSPSNSLPVVINETQLPAAHAAPASVSVQSTELGTDSWTWNLAFWLPVAWLVGVLVALIPLVTGMLQLTLLSRRSRSIEDQSWLALLTELKRQLGIRRPVQLRECTAALVPLTWGALRPVLLVPAEAKTWPIERRRLVLLHELAHVRRWDWLTQFVAHFVCALYWFNPLVWFAARQMRIERERASDDLVLASGARPSDYAQELLTLAAGLRDSRLSTLVAVPMARRGALEDRLRGILDQRRNRAALTTAAVCLSVLLAFVVMTPLAMLRAGAQEPEQPAQPEKPKPEKPANEKPPIEKPAQRDPTPEEIKARETGIRISVLNAKGDKGIPEFRVIAGVNSGVSSEFEKRLGRPVINWQAHTCRVGKEGDYVWPLANAYAEMAIRVEADGYEPQVFTGIKKANGVQHIVFQMQEDKGIAGRVRSANGQPVAGATVGLAIPSRELVWENNKLRGVDDPLPEKPGDRWRRSVFVKTDAEGRFRLPTEFEPAAILIVHEAGVRELAYDDWKKSPDVTLEPWGRIAGQILWGAKPGAAEDVTLTVHRHDYGYPGMVASYARTKTDDQGRFTFDRVLPGHVQISRPIKADGSPGISEVVLNGSFLHTNVMSGGDTNVILGGQGRKVTGKFTGLESWEGATFHFHPEAPHIGFGGDDAMWKAFGQLKQSAAGPLLFRDKQTINKDGTFAIENMLPGNYQLFVSAPGFKNYAASTRIQIAPEKAGEKPAALDLGEVAQVKKPLEGQKPDDKPAAVKGVGPEVQPTKPESKTITIRGKVVDDETGAPIGQLITQAGRYDPKSPADPTKATWGYSEGRSSARDGSFSTTVNWGDGWTARIVADGYIPHPLLTGPPPADKDEFVVTVRLKRGAKVRGVVLDHSGKPLKDAAVYAIGPTGLNLRAGRAWNSWGGANDEAKPVRTDADGRFEIPAGEAKSLAVSHASFDAWPASIPASGEMTIRLPEPARVDVELAIEGADEKSVVFYQLLTHLAPEFAGLQSSHEIPILNPGKLSLTALPPGKYQICRQPMNKVGDISTGAMLDREFFELKAGQTKAVIYKREKGSQLRGKVITPEGAVLSGIVLSVSGIERPKGPFDDHEWPVKYASRTVNADGTFLTERIPPGIYFVNASGFSPLTQEQKFRSGVIGPSHSAQIKFEVPAEGEPAAIELVLKATERK